jgi:Fe-S cluster assembly protein SufD
LVIRGFFAEIIAKIDIDTVEERLMTRIDSQLEKLGA